MQIISRPKSTASSATTALLLGASFIAFASAASAQDAAADAAGANSDETIVVTGSRVITDGSKAPTPITVVSTETLQMTTPSNIPDGLNKLPIFSGSQRPRSPGNGSTAQGSNVLSLRNFGAQRTLILLDGHRVAPSNANGTVSVDTLPQQIIKRVDVVTGGASAVYGSDAVTGVVNFVLDKEFKGFKFDVNSGISTYGDGMSYKFSGAWGTDLFEGRGHFMAAAEHFHTDDVPNFSRPYGKDIFVLTGNGSAGNPFTLSRNVRRADSAFGGKISCVTPCSANGRFFASDGILNSFNAGQATGTSNQSVGGDGAYSIYSTALVEFKTDQLFSRFDYDVTDDINVWVQGTWARGESLGRHFPAKLTPQSSPTVSNSTASAFFKNNPYLSSAVQTALGNNGLSNNSNVFSVGTYIVNLGEEGTVGAQSTNRYWNVMAGASGSLGQFKWDIYYGHGNNRQQVDNLNNSDYQKQFAALDAVVGANGQIQCYATTQGTPGYGNCVPLNAFGPTAITAQMFDWFTDTTTYVMTNVMDNVGASIAGDLFDGWAGPIRGGLSAEARWNKYQVESSANPTDNVNCTGLRICNPNLSRWAQPVLAEITASNNVWEIAGELEVPLLRDLSFAKDLTINLAGRHTEYSTSGAVNTWKAGLTWQVLDGLRFRGATSVDIRAPTLDDLFRPISVAVTGFVDVHTPGNKTLFQQTRGNPNLLPEKARTWTAGVVVEPISGLTFSADYYHIRLDNAITTISATDTAVQQICEDSGGTHFYCSLYTRPLPFSDHTVNNFPSAIYSPTLNSASNLITGWDFEASYVRGAINLRVLANYQPTNITTVTLGLPSQTNVGPKGRITAMIGYSTEKWRIALQDSWQSGYNRTQLATQVYVDPYVRAFNTVDLNIEGKFAAGGGTISPYFTVQNLFNAQPGIFIGGGSIGLTYPVTAGQDIMGRYFTGGLKVRF